MDEQEWQAFLDATRTEEVAGCIIGIVDKDNKRAYLTVSGVKTPEGEKLYQAWVDAGSPPLPETPPPGSGAPAPTVTGLDPVFGPDGTSITITGTGFQARDLTNSQVMIGIDSATIDSWSDTSVTATAVLGANTIDVALAVNLQVADLQQVSAGEFTFNAGAAREGTNRQHKHAKE